MFSTEVSRFFQKTKSSNQAAFRMTNPATSNTNSLQKITPIHLPNPRSPLKLHKSNLFCFTTEYMGKILHSGQKTNYSISDPCTTDSGPKAIDWKVDQTLLEYLKQLDLTNWTSFTVLFLNSSCCSIFLITPFFQCAMSYGISPLVASELLTFI